METAAPPVTHAEAVGEDFRSLHLSCSASSPTAQADSGAVPQVTEQIQLSVNNQCDLKLIWSVQTRHLLPVKGYIEVTRDDCSSKNQSVIHKC